VHVIRFSLTGHAPPTRLQAELFTDAVWSHARRGFGLEHVTVTALATGFDVAVFLRDDAGAPGTMATAIIDSVCESPRFALSWQRLGEPAVVESERLRDLLGDRAEPPDDST
jgi:hypothetical protein